MWGKGNTLPAMQTRVFKGGIKSTVRLQKKKTNKGGWKSLPNLAPGSFANLRAQRYLFNAKRSEKQPGCNLTGRKERRERHYQKKKNQVAREFKGSPLSGGDYVRKEGNGTPRPVETRTVAMTDLQGGGIRERTRIAGQKTRKLPTQETSVPRR